VPRVPGWRALVLPSATPGAARRRPNGQAERRERF